MRANGGGHRRLTAVLVTLVVAVATAAMVGAFLLMPASKPVVAAPHGDGPTNVVYVVIDDLSSDVVPYMSEVGELAAQGVSFDNFFVTDSQCCPSRASTLTGMYPHNSQVKTNTWPDGGFGQFMKHHLDDSMGPALSDAGFRTGFVGKFLNGYNPDGTRKNRADAQPSYRKGFVPPGWDEWHVVGGGYPNFDYTMASSVDTKVATVEQYGHQPEDYLTDVLSGKTSEFLERAAQADDEPFFLTVAPFAVHSATGPNRVNDSVTYPAAPRDRAVSPDARTPAGWPEPQFADGDCGAPDGGCDRVPFPPSDDPSFNELPVDGNRWLPNRQLDDRALERYREMYLDRIRMAQGVNDLIRQLRADLDRLQLADDTYIVFTSDNGFHLGQHGMRSGKNSAFDIDVRVPMIVVPPGGTTASTVDAIGQNTDLLPTFLDIAGAERPGRGTDGRSLLPFVTTPTQAVPGWRQGALVEFTHYDGPGDPDRQVSGPPTYRALRTADYLYVDYSRKRAAPNHREAELYDLTGNPDAMVNIYASLSDADQRALDRALDSYASCARNSCAAAARHLPELDVPTRPARA